MREEDRKKIEELLPGMHCPKNFKCAENGSSVSVKQWILNSKTIYIMP